MRALRILAASLVAFAAFAVSPAGAQTTTTAGTCTAGSGTTQYPPNQCTLVADRTEVGPGGTVNLSGQCPAGTQTVSFRLDPGGADLGTATADAKGNYSKQVTIPTGTAPGSSTITASCSGVQGAGVTRTVAVTVVAGAAALPRTGTSSILPLSAAGVALVALGALVVFAVRRRRQHATTS